MKNRKDIMILARQVIDSEEAIKQGKDIEENKRKIEEIINNLSIPEMYELNDIVLPYFKHRH